MDQTCPFFDCFVEQTDMVPRRGLQDTDQQSFEVFAQRNLRVTFDKMYGQVVAKRTLREVRMKYIVREVSLMFMRRWVYDVFFYYENYHSNIQTRFLLVRCTCNVFQ